MKKILIITTISGFVPQFEMENVRILQRLGYEVHYASNFKTPIYGDDNKRLENTGIICHQTDFAKSPYKFNQNRKAYQQLKRTIKEENINLIHCHTPVGGALGRLAAKACNTKVIYTAHGFHFYKGGPILNWLFYYPVERYLSRYTDTLVTINQEDFQRAKKFYTCKITQINGVGLHTKDFANINIDKNEKCVQIGIEKDKFILCTFGEINKNKNHKVILKAIHELKDKNIVYLICGNGNCINKLKKLSSKFGITDQVKFLGYRSDVKEILSISDCFAFPSKREGLGMAALEAMSLGLPLIASDSRGTREYAINGKTGFVYHVNDYKGFAKGIEIIQNNIDIRAKISGFNKNIVLKFDISNVTPIMEKIYMSF
jgi:glycosyltransferase involved in cell wall biosynthesis